MENNYLLVHGSFGNPFSNWIPYLRKEISNKNLEVYTNVINLRKYSLKKVVFFDIIKLE